MNRDPNSDPQNFAEHDPIWILIHNPYLNSDRKNVKTFSDVSVPYRTLRTGTGIFKAHGRRVLALKWMLASTPPRIPVSFHSSVSDPYSSNPDPDPAKNLNPDPSYFLPVPEFFLLLHNYKIFSSNEV